MAGVVASDSSNCQASDVRSTALLQREAVRSDDEGVAEASDEEEDYIVEDRPIRGFCNQNKVIWGHITHRMGLDIFAL